MHRADTLGLSIAYRRSGAGPVLALLRGFACDSRMWRPQLEGLARDFTVVAWDATGAGLSSDPPDSFETADWADCLAGVLDELGARRAHVVGLSWGGIVAQEFYRRHPGAHELARSVGLGHTRSPSDHPGSHPAHLGRGGCAVTDRRRTAVLRCDPGRSAGDHSWGRPREQPRGAEPVQRRGSRLLSLRCEQGSGGVSPVRAHTPPHTSGSKRARAKPGQSPRSSGGGRISRPTCTGSRC
jgi:pimeloyl-ACP methyl ester carboxylesterase